MDLTFQHGSIIYFIKAHIKENHLQTLHMASKKGCKWASAPGRHEFWSSIKYRGSSTRCKPFISLKNRKARLEFVRKHTYKETSPVLWTDKTKINLYQNDGRRKVWRRLGMAHDLKHTTSSVKHGGDSIIALACILQWVVFIVDMTEDRSSRMNSEVYRNILSAHI